MSAVAESAVQRRAPAPAAPPPLARPEFQRIFYPALVAVLLIGLWQWWVTAFEHPQVPGAVAAGWWRRRWSPTRALLLRRAAHHA